jgi:glycosyltransferase involved in cell wall biosynthesis
LRRGHDVRVFCLHAPGSLAPQLQSSGVPVVCGYKRSGPDPRVVWALRNMRAPGQRTVFHSHSMMPNYYACAARLLAPGTITVVNTRHDMGSTRPGDLREKLYRLSIPLTRLAVMVSQEVLTRFVTARIVPAKKARVVLNGILTDCPQRSNAEQRHQARQTLGAADDELIAGCVGRLVELKNHAAALHSIAALSAEFPSLRLVLIGDGPLRPYLGALANQLGIGNRVKFLGERDDARALLPALDAFVMPSLTEGHSIALLEAAAAGCPIVATRVGGTPEIIGHTENGLLVAAGDNTALAASLGALLRDRTLAMQLGNAARAWALRSVSVQAMTDAYDRVYREALGI